MVVLLLPDASRTDGYQGSIFLVLLGPSKLHFHFASWIRFGRHLSVFDRFSSFLFGFVFALATEFAQDLCILFSGLAVP